MSIEKITIKELQLKLNIGRTAAQQVYADVKKEYDIKIVTMAHVIEYLKIPVAQSYS